MCECNIENLDCVKAFFLFMWSSSCHHYLFKDSMLILVKYIYSTINRKPLMLAYWFLSKQSIKIFGLVILLDEFKSCSLSFHRIILWRHGGVLVSTVAQHLHDWGSNPFSMYLCTCDVFLFSPCCLPSTVQRHKGISKLPILYNVGMYVPCDKLPHHLECTLQCSMDYIPCLRPPV